jgi:hypothetical protein
MLDESNVPLLRIEDSWGSFPEMEYIDDIEQPPPLNVADIAHMTYDEWIQNGYFVPANKRPKPVKHKGSRDYEYHALKHFDDIIQKESLKSMRKHRKPDLIVNEQCFLYGFVVEVLPRNVSWYSSVSMNRNY